MKPTVYIETSIISYLVARPSRDVLRLVANARFRKKLEAICRSHGFEPSIICTPEALIAEE